MFTAVSELVVRRRYRCELPPRDLLDALDRVVEPGPREFPLISRISGAGIVVRALRVPATTRPFFGVVEGDRLAIAQTSREEATPFQPILRGVVRDDEGGSTLELELRPHAEVPTFATAGKVAGGLVIAGAAPALLSGEPLAVLAMGFGALFWVFPGLRARASFGHGCARSLVALEERLPLCVIDEVAVAGAQSPRGAGTGGDAGR